MADKRPRIPLSVDVAFNNDDLLSKILLFIPAKPLICMKLVSKRWRSLISAKPFRCLHALYHRSSDHPPSFIIRANPKCFFYFSPMRKIFRPYNFRLTFPRILQSSHGLLLLQVRKYRQGEKHYYVYNPTTLESRKISVNEIESVLGLCLAFDPGRSSFYKVISIKRDKKYSSLYWIEIYDSKTSAWIRSDQPFTATNYTTFTNAIFWNNCIYWIRKFNEKSYYLDLETGIVGRPPRVLTHKRWSSGSQKNFVMESNRHLHYVSLYSRQNKINLKVSELLHDLVWFEKYKLNLNPVFSKLQVAVLCITRGDKEADSTVLFLVQGKIIFYRFCDGYFKDLFLQTKEFYKDGRLHYQRNHAYQFIESLIPNSNSQILPKSVKGRPIAWRNDNEIKGPHRFR